MPKIIIAGSINMDVVARVARHPLPGETVFGSSLHYIPGGKGGNQAVGASRLNPDVWLVGKLGRDAFGERLMQFLHNERLHLAHVTHTETHPTGVALIYVDEESENSIVVVSGSNYALDVVDIERLPIEADDVVVSVFEIPQPIIKALFERARIVGAKTILNPAPAVAFIDGLQDLVDVLIVNETELAFFAEEALPAHDDTTINTQAQRLRVSPAQTIIVTLGSQGLLCVDGDGVYRIPSRRVPVVDTTGAGDCFTGALAVAFYEGMPTQDALYFANTAASISVQTLGAAVSMPTRAMVDEVLSTG